MNRLKTILAMLVALAIAIYIPNASLAQSDQSGQSPVNQGYVAEQQGQPVNPGQTGRSKPQPVGGLATVIGVDQPDDCLRIRSGPGNQYDVIGCANMGDQLNITGVWTSNDWAQLADNGWVYGPQIETDLRPPRTAYSRRPTYVVSQGVVPDYDDWSYLPDYGYDTYWYGGMPIFLYNVAVWNWWHPWWWWHGLHAWWWQDGFHGKRVWNHQSFKNFATNRGVNVASAQRTNMSALNTMGRNTRSASIASSNVNRLNVNRSNITSPNVNRFNANRSNITSPNVNKFNANRSNITSPNVNKFNANRFGTSTNAVRSQSFSTPSTPRSRNFSSPSFNTRTFSSPNIGTRSFSRPNISTRSFSPNVGTRSFSSPSFSTRSFSSPSFSTRSFSSPARMGSVGAKSFSMGPAGGVGGGPGGRRR